MSIQKSVKKRVFKLVLFLAGIGLIVRFTRDISRLLKSGEQVKLAEEKVLQLEKNQEELQKERQYYLSDDFVEEEARNKLNMARPGETIVILPPNLSEVLGRQTKPPTLEIPNWKKWWKLFF